MSDVTPTTETPPTENPPTDPAPSQNLVADSTGQEVKSPIVGVAGLANGTGYFAVTADGYVHTFGNAQQHGSIADLVENGGVEKPTEPVVGIVAFDNNGYGLVTADGKVYGFGAFPFKAS